MKDYKDKVAVVTGAASGIGQALVIELAKRGAKLAFCDIKSLEDTQHKIAVYNSPCYSEIVDMGDKSAIRRFTNNIIQHYDGVDLLINNAGIALGDRNFSDLTSEDFEKITNINYWGVIETTLCLYHNMLTRPQAAIVNISSAQGILVSPYLNPYCTTKFAIRGFTDSLRLEHQIRGIKNLSVHCVHPGRVATDITRHADYHNVRSDIFHKELQKGSTPSSAAKTILKGITKNKGRIFISDGWLQDMVARVIPNSTHHLIRLIMKFKKLEIT
jgi:NAD(P)-dependent dehydrogenase (short-subunit alcohol dehydrogenase family)